MKELELFNFIERTTDAYEKRMPLLYRAEKMLQECYNNMELTSDNSVVNTHTRIKRVDSLKEKLMRYKFYLYYDNGDDALDHIHDLIGIRIECRFIRNEAELYQHLFSYFNSTSEEYSQCISDSNNYLNLRMIQPQIQRNGFTIYRIDGYYIIDGVRINYELQIKSLVHRFWSEIEHEVVYKNPDFVTYDRFMKSMLEAVRDNLDVVDRQLEIIYDEISHESKHTQIGLDETGFKRLATTSINELVKRQMKENVGFASDFKNNAATLAQYIYIKDFINKEDTKTEMVNFLEHLNLLSVSDIDYTLPIKFNHDYIGQDAFSNIFGEYLQSVMNDDFEWHVFFVTLFALGSDDPLVHFDQFIKTYKKLIIQPSWFNEKFNQYGKGKAKWIRGYYEKAFIEAIVNVNRIEIIHENNMIRIMDVFRVLLDNNEILYESFEEHKENLPNIARSLKHQIHRLFI